MARGHVFVLFFCCFFFTLFVCLLDFSLPLRTAQSCLAWSCCFQASFK